jgi:hypothetical protein
MKDLDEVAVRRKMIESGQPARDFAADLDEKLDSAALAAKYDVLSFAAPFVIVKRRSDGVVGTLEFTHSPRWYFGWKPDKIS